MGMANMQGVGAEMGGQYTPNMTGLPAQTAEGMDSGQGHGLPQDGSGYAQNQHNVVTNDYSGQGEGDSRGETITSHTTSTQTSGNSGRGGSYGSGYRGRGGPQPPQAPARSRAGYRGRGLPPHAPTRSTSPLPPNVPTGPRSQTRYKDRDGPSGPSDGLDYGGHKDGHYSHHDDDRSSRSRKRRASPRGDEYGRSSKRR